MNGLVEAADMQLGAEFLANPPACSHAVQFYEGDEFLLDAVVRYIGSGLTANDQVLAIATAAHTRAIVSRLAGQGHAVDRVLETGQLVLVDAEQLLALLMLGDMPDPERFLVHAERTLALLSASEFAKANDTARPIRAFGEMVDLLARRGNVRAAIRLEELWCEAGRERQMNMLCGYGISSFHDVSVAEHFGELCHMHAPVLPTERYMQLPDARLRLLEVSRLQQRARALEYERQQRRELEAALQAALHAHTAIEEELRVTVKREREARGRAEASQAFKEVFLGMLGHELRNPLNAILTTARLMKMQREHDAETKKRIGRVVTSGERMHRMIEQILDTTRARLTAGIVLSLGESRDIVPIVQEVVGTLRALHVHRRFELQADVACPARVDEPRFSQVILNLLDNAIAHGDPNRPIRVDVTNDGGVVCIGVHNHGEPIASERLAQLFDPFARGGKPQGKSAGLGLGLYISQHVVRAHGGNLTVESSADAGTRFEIRLPCP